MEKQNHLFEFKKLAKVKSKLLKKGVLHEKDEVEDIQKKAKSFYDQVVYAIRDLGSITENQGHIEVLDHQKNKLYSLLRL